MPSSIFLCHSSKDKEFARKLSVDLESRGVKVWIDEAELKPGDSLIGKLEAAIDEVDYLGIILSEHSVSSEWVLKELRMAMHREISGKRVVVVPILYRDCKVPGFLRDKIYVDVRPNIDYDKGVSEILRRIQHDVEEEIGTNELFEVVNDLPFTRMWRAALSTNTFSERFLSYLKNLLASMEPGTDSWDPLTAVSYTAFLNELVQEGKLTQNSWKFLCDVIETNSIVAWLRYWTLDRTLRAASRLQTVRIPDIAIEHPTSEDYNVLTLCITALFEPLQYNTVTQDSQTPIRVLSFLWTFGSPEYRKALADRLNYYAGQNNPNFAEVAEHLNRILSERNTASIEKAFSELRNLWASLHDEGSLRRDRHLVHATLERFLKEAGEMSPTEIVELFHRVSQRNPDERYDFDLYMLAGMLFNNLKLLRKRQGDEAIFKILVALINDERLDLELSCLALGSLINEFGIEALYLDDQLPFSLFHERGKAPHKYSIAEILCELVAGEKKDESEMTTVLIAVFLALDKAGRTRLKAIVDIRADQSKRLTIIKDLIEEKISIKDAVKKLERL